MTPAEKLTKLTEQRFQSALRRELWRGAVLGASFCVMAFTLAAVFAAAAGSQAPWWVSCVCPAVYAVTLWRYWKAQESHDVLVKAWETAVENKPEPQPAQQQTLN